ncbi:MAG: hypothetical protein JEY94_11630 [Melioribacteraceae bacterium]|nr:hypothetical protein [Melioribacteraceae bacterium]
MWIEINDQLINLSHVIKVNKKTDLNELEFHTDQKIIIMKMQNTNELEQVYFNLLEMLGSKPVDGFRK